MFWGLRLGEIGYGRLVFGAAGTITGELKSKVDKLWETFWSNGISNPISVIEQISYLLFIKRLDDEELKQERKTKRLGKRNKSPIFVANQQICRWSYFKNLDNPDEKLKAVRDQAFPFIKSLKGEAGDSTYAHHMRDAIFLIANPALLASVMRRGIRCQKITPQWKRRLR